MTWPTPPDTTALDSDTDTLQTARPQIKGLADKLVQLIEHVTVPMRALLGSADAAAARTTLDVPSKNGAGATGTWGISVSGNAATATTAANVSRSVTTAGLASGGGLLDADRAITVTEATTAEALAGTGTGVMTARRVAEALAAMQSLGVGQAWQNVLTSPGRVQNTVYQNTTGRAIQVAVAADADSGQRSFQVSSDNINWTLVGRFAEGSGTRENNAFPVIPAGWYYRVVGPASITHWAELR